MGKLFNEKTLKAIRKQVREELRPMWEAMVEYHLKKSKEKSRRK